MKSHLSIHEKKMLNKMECNCRSDKIGKADEKDEDSEKAKKIETNGMNREKKSHPK